MTFSAVDVIRKKRDGQTNSEQELKALLEGYLRDEVKDYQMAAWLMAVFFRGMEPEEMRVWARLMWHSGGTFPRADRAGFWVDKHSTGGVGDKTSLILVPLVHHVCEALLGPGQVRIPMISGRGLDFSGGTLDKLESVPGFCTALSWERAQSLLDDQGFFMIGQTQDIAPADRKLYALRDVTATVECLPLIVSSILSKKLAENLDGLVFDVKFGAGAFMSTLEQGRALGQALTLVAAQQGVKSTALLTRMDEPLGWKVGNHLEVEESADYLAGTSRERGLHEVTQRLAAEMVALASRGKVSLATAAEACEQALHTPGPLRTFQKMFAAQGGDWAAFEAHRLELERRPRHLVRAATGGYLASLDARFIGKLVRALGGGRQSKDTLIDRDVGVILKKKVGDPISAGEILLEVIYSPTQMQEAVLRDVSSCFTIHSDPVIAQPWVQEVVSCSNS